MKNIIFNNKLYYSVLTNMRKDNRLLDNLIID